MGGIIIKKGLKNTGLLFALLFNIIIFPKNVVFADNNKVKVTSLTVNIRKGYSIDHEIIDKAYKEDVFEFYNISDNGWYAIKTKDGVEAWISKDHVTEIEESKKELKNTKEETKE